MELAALEVNVEPRITSYLRNSFNVKEEKKQRNNKRPIKKDNVKEKEQRSIFNTFRAIKDTTSIKQTQEAIKESRDYKAPLELEI